MLQKGYWNFMIIAIDIDSTLADLTTEWLRCYNQDYGDHLSTGDLKAWSIHTIVKPECGEKIYDYLKDRTFYEPVQPYPGTLEVVRWLRERGHRVIFVTSTPPEGAGCKLFWLRKHGFLPEGHVAPDYYECYDKSLIRADLLIDDGYHNVEKFPGSSILFTQPWNEIYEWKHRAANWQEVRERVDLIEAGLSTPHPTEIRFPRQARLFREIMEKMYQTHLDKSADYSPANVLGAGEIGLCTRAWDKMARLMNLMGFKIELSDMKFEQPREPKNESIEDSILDLAVYCIIWLIYRRKAWGK